MMHRTRAARAASVAAVLVVLSCAKKMLPPSPDRFAPGLEDVTARSRVQFELVFDEPIDAAKLQSDSFSLRGADSVMRVRGVARGRDASRVLVWTELLPPGSYSVAGVVWDASGNRRRFSVRFRGSAVVDTIAPRVKRTDPAPGTAGLRGIPTVSVAFSEPMDTSTQVLSLFAPARLDSAFSRSWSADWQELRYVYTDSGRPAGPVYFTLLPGTRDLEGNRSTGAAYTYFTADSVLQGQSVRGKLVSRGPVVGTGIVCFDREETEALVPARSDGTFELVLLPAVYTVRAAADTNLDGLADLVGVVDSFSPLSESIDILLGPEGELRPLDAYRR